MSGHISPDATSPDQSSAIDSTTRVVAMVNFKAALRFRGEPQSAEDDPAIKKQK